MKLRAAIRYSEYKAAGKLPESLNLDCKDCLDKGLQEKRNCGGEGNSKYSVIIGNGKNAIEYNQCPLSIPDKETWDVIELISMQEETGIPIYGHCLMDQTPEMFKFRRIILDERGQCMREIHEKDRKDIERKNRQIETKGKAPTSRSRLK